MHQYAMKKDCLPHGYASEFKGGVIMCRRLPGACPLQGRGIECQQPLVDRLKEEAKKQAIEEKLKGAKAQLVR